MNNYVPGQISFDTPLAAPPPMVSGTSPLAQAIAMHEQVKAVVAGIRDPLESADVEIIRIRRIREGLNAQMRLADAEMDSAMRTKHTLQTQWKEAVAAMNAVADQVKEMGGVPLGNNSFGER